MRKITEFLGKIKKKHLSYKNKLIISCSLCVFFTCILCSSLALYKYYKLQKNAITETFQSLAEEAGKVQESRIKDYRKQGSIFAQNEDMIQYFGKADLDLEEYASLFRDVEPAVNRLNNTNQDILNDILIFTANDKICQPEKKIYSMETLKTMEFGKVFLEGEKKYTIFWDKEGAICPYLRSEKAEGLDQAYVYLERFFHINGKQMCVLAFVISSEKMFRENYILKSCESYAVVQENQVLAEKEVNGENYRESDKWMKSVERQTGAMFYLKMDLSPLNGLKVIIVVFYALVLFAIVMITLLIHRIISHMFMRLNGVIDSMNEIELGDFKELLEVEEVDQGDEVFAITVSFNQLLLRLEKNAEEMLLREREKKNAEILALQYQINPHFLCNSMHIIQLAVEEKGCYEISDAIAYFVSVLRYNISGTMDAVVGEEIENVQEYIYFLSFCRGADIQVTMDIPESLKDSYIMKFILQPVVENAVYHGYDRNARQMHLSFRIYMEMNFLHFEIANDGMKIDEEVLGELNKRLSAPLSELAVDGNRKIGLINIAYRMKLRFDSRANVYMTSEEGRTVFHMCYPNFLLGKEEL